LGGWKTLLGFVLAFALLSLFVWRADIDLRATWEQVKRLDLWRYGAAFVLFLAALPLRAWRWRLILRGAGIDVDSAEARGRWSGLGALTELLWLSWFVNGLLPARLGDLYRADLLRRNAQIPLSQSLGTLFAERVVDLLSLAGLLLASGVASFGLDTRGGLDTVYLGASILLAFLLLSLLGLWGLGPWLEKKLPARIRPTYQRFYQAALAVFRAKNAPLILLGTLSIWLSEGLRLGLVASAMGVPLGVVPLLFVALLGSLLGNVPALPGGIGVTEAGVTGALIFMGLPRDLSFAVTNLDRLINTWFVLTVGAILYAVSKRK
jgi:hypothetical protein